MNANPATHRTVTGLERFILSVTFLCFSWTAMAGEILFPHPVYGVGRLAGGAASADLNRDGPLDLVVVNNESSSVSLLFGNGDGTFAEEVLLEWRCGEGVEVVVADFDGNQWPDLAISSLDCLEVVVFLGTGGGAFSPPTFHPVPGSAWALVTDDFNDDGRPDLATGCYYNCTSGSLAVFLGNGDGTFALSVPGLFVSGDELDSGHFNGDPYPDLVSVAPVGAAVNVLLGNGDGTFADPPSVSVEVGGSPTSPQVADLDGNGLDDVALLDRDTGEVIILLRTGPAEFSAPTRFASAGDRGHLRIGDFDGDDRPDIATINDHLEDVSILRGHGDGTFTLTGKYSRGRGPSWGSVVGDFNQDGFDDLAAVNGYGSDVSVLLANENGTFPNVLRFREPSDDASLAVGDLNGDGFPDLGLAYSDVRVRLGDGVGNFGAESIFAAGLTPSGIAIGDIDGDQQLDLIVANFDSNDISLLQGNGDGTFQPEQRLPVGSAPSAVAVADLDLDGLADIVTANAQSGDVSVVVHDAEGGLLPATPYGAGGGPAAVTIGDIDGDGLLDLVVANETSDDVSVLVGMAGGGFETQVTLVAGAGPRAVQVGDVNDDLILDLVVANGGSNDLSILLGNGVGGFLSEQRLAVGDEPVSLVIADLSGDGMADLATADRGSGRMSVLLNDGSGGFPDRSRFGTGSAPAEVVAVDLDGDDRLDLVTAEWGSVSVFLNQGEFPTQLMFLADKETFGWPGEAGTQAYNVYRGSLAELIDGDGDGHPDTGLGECQNSRDPDTSDNTFPDPDVPAAGDGFYYLVAAGQDLGTTSAGLPRWPTVACPSP